MRAVRGTGRARRTHDEAGFTLVELLVALTLLLFVIGTAVQYLRKQSTFVAVQSIRSDALQNAEFAVSQVDRELREAGAGVVDIQPMLVQVDSDAVTFNANMVSIDSGDVRAVYQ
jgi:prepilin-type N-terminal cleavage/methylation domain-containing protein